MFDVAIIIVNYNTAKYTLECIHAIREQSQSNATYQVVVVDNNSELEDYKQLSTNFPQQENFVLHRSPINTGFGGGNMLGLPHANARYLLFLNNDAMLLNDCLQILTHYMDIHSKVGVCTAQNYDEHNKFVPSFDHNKGLRRLLFGRGFLEKLNASRYPKRKQEYTESLEADWVNGAFLFFRTEAFEKVGGFDTSIFLYWEEMDICHRLKENGYKSTLVPEAKVLHYQGVSTGTSKVLSKESYSSYLYVIKKNYGFIKWWLVRLYLTLALLVKPKKWYLLSTVLDCNPMTHSLKQQQKVRFYEE
jgi:GT2 family glycosyltransferase